MKRIAPLLMILVTAMLVDVCAAQIAESLKQPAAKAPGNWKLVKLPFPSLEAAQNVKTFGRPVYGLYAWCGEYRTFREDIKKVGIRSVRIAGPFDDESFKMMVEDDMEIMYTASSRFIKNAENCDRDDFDTDEAFIKAYCDRMKKFLGRYGPKGTFFKENPKLPHRPLKFIEIWNEPNFQYMISPKKELTRPQVEAQREKLYAKLLPAAYKTIKKDWPDVKVVGFGAGGSGHGDIRFFRNVLKNNPEVAKSFDILSTHPYPSNVPPEADSVRSWGSYNMVASLKEIREIFKEYGREDLPVWYTEIGYHIAQKYGGQFSDKKGGGAETSLNPDLQAAYVLRTYAMAMRLGVGRVHIMFISDSDGFNGGFFERKTKKWRPAAYATQHMIKLMPNPRLLSANTNSEKGKYSLLFQPNTAEKSNQNAMMMVWGAGTPFALKLPEGPDVTLSNMLGQKPVVFRIGHGPAATMAGAYPLFMNLPDALKPKGQK